MPPGSHVSVGAGHSSEPAGGGATGSCTPQAWFPGLRSRLLGEGGLCGEKCSADGPTPLVLPAGHLPLRLWPSCITCCHTGPRSLPSQHALATQSGCCVTAQPCCSHHHWQVPLTSLPNPLATAQLPAPSTSYSIETEEETKLQ